MLTSIREAKPTNAKNGLTFLRLYIAAKITACRDIKYEKDFLVRG